MEKLVKAPYNFVPLSEFVYCPPEPEKISLDVPFSDGISGSVSFKMTARTPISINDEERSGFCYDGYRHFIPASSIKGAIRNVFRIISFSKIGRIDNHSYGIRNVNDPDYRANMRGIRCGWMYQNDKGIFIDDCGTPKRISYFDIFQKIKSEERVVFPQGRKAFDKYRLLVGEPFTMSQLEYTFSPDNRRKDKRDRREFYRFNKSSTQRGTIVLTGQVNKKKKFEFIFLKPNDNSATLIVPENLFEAFVSIHKASDDYELFWKKRFNRGERIPVFFKRNEDGKSIHSIGLSYMYKYPYRHSVADAVGDSHMRDTLDMTEQVFGYTSTTGDDALKGRVHFGQAFATQSNRVKSQDVLLSNPRSSFYPFYLKGGKSWNDDNICVSGIKRYPVRNSVVDYKSGNKKLDKTLYLLPEGAVFEEVIHFHNLRPYELGGLLSAITFHGNEEICSHSIGAGKPLGYGRINISDVRLAGETVSGEELKSVKKYMAIFENTMKAFCDQYLHAADHHSWLGSPQMVQLFLMAKGIPEGKECSFEYMGLNSFKDVRNQGLKLESFGKRIDANENFSLPSLNNE